MTRYRVQYTQIKPGGHLDRQDELLTCNTLADVADYISSLATTGEPTIWEQSGQSDGTPRLVTAAEFAAAELGEIR